MKTLKLVEYFLSHDFPQLAYYCQLRESSPGKKDIKFVDGPADFQFAGLTFDYRHWLSFADKYANRGPSAILDYLVPIGSKPGKTVE